MTANANANQDWAYKMSEKSELRRDAKKHLEHFVNIIKEEIKNMSENEIKEMEESANELKKILEKEKLFCDYVDFSDD